MFVMHCSSLFWLVTNNYRLKIMLSYPHLEQYLHSGSWTQHLQWEQVRSYEKFIEFKWYKLIILYLIFINWKMQPTIANSLFQSDSLFIYFASFLKYWFQIKLLLVKTISISYMNHDEMVWCWDFLSQFKSVTSTALPT